jgi:hypothetical protein
MLEYEVEFSVKFDGMVDMGNGKTELKVCCCKGGDSLMLGVSSPEASQNVKSLILMQRAFRVLFTCCESVQFQRAGVATTAARVGKNAIVVEPAQIRLQTSS